MFIHCYMIGGIEPILKYTSQIFRFPRPTVVQGVKNKLTLSLRDTGLLTSKTGDELPQSHRFNKVCRTTEFKQL